MPVVVDYFGRASAARRQQLRNAGVIGVVRYLCPIGSSSKRIVADEYNELVADGFSVGLVWEQNETAWQSGRGRGLRDGQDARAQADALGFPHDRPIYAAYDMGVYPNQLALAADYMAGFTQGAGGGPQGAYGTSALLQELWNRGLIRWAWRTNAHGWVGNDWEFQNICLRQHFKAPLGPVDPASVDVNDICAPDWGQHNFVTAHTGPTITPIPIPAEDDDMKFTILTGPTAAYLHGEDGSMATFPPNSLAAYQKAHPDVPVVAISKDEATALTQLESSTKL